MQNAEIIYLVGATAVGRQGAGGLCLLYRKEPPARHTGCSDSTFSIATLQVHDLIGFICINNLHSQIGSCYLLTVRLERVKLYQS
ncbi:MAG: hypothetical protein FWH20_07405 [Oscillospiraceae bacterium]|nr:hypothetical protein [Oscillospiraceae bacterium]